MAVEILKDRYGSKVGTLTIGNGPAEGGTLTSVITVAVRAPCPPIILKESCPHRPGDRHGNHRCGARLEPDSAGGSGGCGFDDGLGEKVRRRVWR